MLAQVLSTGCPPDCDSKSLRPIVRAAPRPQSGAEPAGMTDRAGLWEGAWGRARAQSQSSPIHAAPLFDSVAVRSLMTTVGAGAIGAALDSRPDAPDECPSVQADVRFKGVVLGPGGAPFAGAIAASSAGGQGRNQTTRTVSTSLRHAMRVELTVAATRFIPATGPRASASTPRRTGQAGTDWTGDQSAPLSTDRRGSAGGDRSGRAWAACV